MGNLASLVSPGSAAADYAYQTRKKNDLREEDERPPTVIQSLLSTESLKVIAIIVLLTSSVLLSGHPPSTAPSSDAPFERERTTHAAEREETDENPDGFHPFYQVHKRVRFQNPKNESPCSGINPSRTLLLAVLSRASNVHIREAIRQTWGAVRAYNGIEVRVSFIVGVDDKMLKQIEFEQSIYHGKLRSSPS